MNTSEFRTNLDSLASIEDYVLQMLEHLKLPADLIHDIRLVVEEIFANIVLHAGSDTEENVRVECFMAPDGLFFIRFRDRGIPFNPLEHKPHGLDLDFAERQPGGLGIHLVKRLAHEIHYAREGDSNVLTVCFRC